MKSGFKPMLSGTVEDINELSYPLLASPKLDGIRAVIIDGVVLSRNLKPIPNRHVQKLFGKKSYNGFDGELIVGDPTKETAFRDTTSAVMSEDGKPEVQFYVFDRFSQHYEPYRKRFSGMAHRLGRGCVPWASKIVTSPEELTALEEAWLAQGYEGAMLRDPESRYKYGRSTLREGILLKLKRFMDSEAVILDAEEEMQNTNAATTDELGGTKRSSHKAGLVGKGRLGALHVRDVHSGVEFSIGSGFNGALRDDLWLAGKLALRGKVVRYSYFPTGSKEKPRFPVFQGFRDPIDL